MKANLPVLKCFLLSIMGGIFVAFGGALAVSVGPCCPELAASNPGLVKIISGGSVTSVCYMHDRCNINQHIMNSKQLHA